jgi:hypothetical protein
VLSVSRDGEAQVFSGDGERGSRILAELVRARLDVAASEGLMISGMERDEITRDDIRQGYRARYRYQQWWLTYVE